MTDALASNDKPIIESWHGFKLSPTTAEVVLIGEDFGSLPGIVELVLQGSGRYTPEIIVWSDTFVRLAVPVDSIVKNVTMTVLDNKTRKAKRAKFVKRTDASTGAQAAAWSVTSITDAPDVLTIAGADLDLVEEVVLFDNDNPVGIYSAAYTEDAGDLIVEWPADFTGTIEEVRLLAQSLQQISSDAGSYSPDSLPLVTGASGVLLPGGIAGVDLFGIGFGATPGSVELRPVGGGLQAHDVLFGGWTDNGVRIVADPCVVYDQVRVTTSGSDSVTADISATTPPLPDTTCMFAVLEGNQKIRMTIPGGGLLNGFSPVDGLHMRVNGSLFSFASPQMTLPSDNEIFLDLIAPDNIDRGWEGYVFDAILAIRTSAGDLYTPQMPYVFPVPLTIPPFTP